MKLFLEVQVVQLASVEQLMMGQNAEPLWHVLLELEIVG